MNMIINTLTSQKHKQLLQKVRQLNLDISQIIAAVRKDERWDEVKGILNKRPTGLKHQRNMRDEWI